HNLFETEIDHRDEAFVNFSGSGARVGHDQARPGAQATAETTFTNCLFEHCDRGLALLQFNDYDFTVAGCEFRGCGTALYGGKGCNCYVRDSRFEDRRVEDVLDLAEHACSVRRCFSTGARLFLRQESIAPLTIQDCVISGWKNPEGAVRLSGGPVLLFDCRF